MGDVSLNYFDALFSNILVVGNVGKPKDSDTLISVLIIVLTCTFTCARALMTSCQRTSAYVNVHGVLAIVKENK